MNKKLLIDYDEVRNLFDEEYKQTMQLIEAGETHLDNLAEGFTEADRVLFRLMFLHPKTNADRIRAMSDEELVDALMAFLVKSVENGESSEAKVKVEFEEGYRDALLEELRQPVEDGGG